MANSEYKLKQIHQVFVGGLSGFAKRLRQSKLEHGKGYRPLHENASRSNEARSRKKLTGNSNWYKNERNEMNPTMEDLDKNIEKTRKERRKEEMATSKRNPKKERKKKGLWMEANWRQLV